MRPYTINILRIRSVYVKWYLAAGPVAVAGLLLFTVAYSQEGAIPDWIRSSAGWWADGLISDAEYMASIQWLIDEGYLNLDGESQRLVREGQYSIEQPDDWERQVPTVDESSNGIRDSMIKLETIDDQIPAIISVSAGGMLGENITEHRTVGLDLIYEYLGDAFNHTHYAETDVVGNPGYVDEYTVSVFGVVVQGISYSFEFEGRIYEIKYESGTENFPAHLDEFEGLVKTFRLE